MLCNCYCNCNTVARVRREGTLRLAATDGNCRFIPASEHPGNRHQIAGKSPANRTRLGSPKLVKEKRFINCSTIAPIHGLIAAIASAIVIAVAVAVVVFVKLSARRRVVAFYTLCVWKFKLIAAHFRSTRARVDLRCAWLALWPSLQRRDGSSL